MYTKKLGNKSDDLSASDDVLQDHRFQNPVEGSKTTDNIIVNNEFRHLNETHAQEDCNELDADFNFQRFHLHVHALRVRLKSATLRKVSVMFLRW